MAKKLEHVPAYKRHPWGNLELGQQCLDGVITGIGLQAFNSIHYIHLDSTGAREGWTLCRNPGVFEIKCGDKVSPDSTGIDIDILANGEDLNRGHIKLEANQDIKLKAGGAFDLTAENGYRLFSPKVGKIIANTELFTVTNFMKGLTCASASKLGKTDFANTFEFLTFTNQSPIV